MQKLGFENARHLDDHPSGSEKPYRRQSSANVETTRSPREEDEKYMEITLDIQEDSVSVYGVKSPEQLEYEGQSFLRPGRYRRSNSILRSIVSSVSDELKRVASSVSAPYTRKPPQQRLDRLPRSKAKAEVALKGLKFITKSDGLPGWPGVEERFNKLTKKSNNYLHRSKFGECIGMDTEEFALALFDALRRRRNESGDSLSKDELRGFWELINDQDFDSRLRTFFAMVDKDSDGRLNKDEVKEIIALSATANKLENIRIKADEYAALIMEYLDPYQFGYIMIQDLEILLLQAPMQTMSTGENKILSRMLSHKLKESQSRNLGVRFYRGVKYFLFDNWKRVWVMALWIGVMAGLFTWKFMQYRKRSPYQVMGACVCLAKGAAETLKLNMAMILLPVCKNTITWLRTKTKLSAVVPFDDNTNFHKVIAIAISVGVGIHATAHLACDFPRLIAADEDKYKPMETYFGPQTKSYMDFVKSVEGVTGIAMVILMTIAFTLATTCLRRNKLKLPVPLKKITGFNAFWYSHHLFFIVYSLLIVHGYYLYLIKPWYKKTTWMYLMVPVVLYLLERLIRAFRSSVEAVSVLKATVLPEKVLSLYMSRPNNFKYKSGQYIYLKCPTVSSLEWHPFSITSAPGDEYLSVHIRDKGDWTNQLLSVFDKANSLPTDENRLNRTDWNSIPEYPKVLVDGPYGAPSQDYKKFEVLLLVGLGIGATPMISIVKNIVNHIRGNGEGGSDRRQSPLSPTTKGETFKTKKAYLYWVTREQGSLNWFKKVMDEVTETDRNNVIELHNHCTNVYGEGDARSALITMIQSLNHEKNGVDAVSGARVMAHFARPTWRSVFKRIAVEHPDTRVGVFYCGPGGGVAKQVRDLARDFSQTNISTNFCFHKENF